MFLLLFLKRYLQSLVVSRVLECIEVYFLLSFSFPESIICLICHELKGVL
jgi:hypothetical protein